MTSAYPLAWPEGWPRTPERKRIDRARFVTTFDKARRDLQKELQRLGASNVVISSWLPLRLDGNPRSDVARYRIEDPGVAVYFTLRDRPMVMARDAYHSIHDNLRSIGLAISHLRGLERHGGGTMMDRAFDGFAALPAPDKVGWRSVLGNHGDLPSAEAAYKSKAKLAHANGGEHEVMVNLNLAMEEARQFFRGKAA